MRVSRCGIRSDELSDGIVWFCSQLRAGDALQREIPAQERKTGQSGRSRIRRGSRKRAREREWKRRTGRKTRIEAGI